MKDDEEKEKIRRQVELIHLMATWLPWIAVLAAFVTMSIYILMAYLNYHPS